MGQATQVPAAFSMGVAVGHPHLWVTGLITLGGLQVTHFLRVGSKWAPFAQRQVAVAVSKTKPGGQHWHDLVAVS